GNGVCEADKGESSSNCPQDCAGQDCSLNNQPCVNALNCCSFYAVGNLCFYSPVCNVGGSGKCSFTSKVCGANEVCTAEGCKSGNNTTFCDNDGVCEGYLGEKVGSCSDCKIRCEDICLLYENIFQEKCFKGPECVPLNTCKSKKIPFPHLSGCTVGSYKKKYEEGYCEIGECCYSENIEICFDSKASIYLP
ncbi:MAG: hypothetical protein QXU20_04170, partial [Candidatus Woesearchaeota archaeon]